MLLDVKVILLFSREAQPTAIQIEVSCELQSAAPRDRTTRRDYINVPTDSQAGRINGPTYVAYVNQSSMRHPMSCRPKRNIVSARMATPFQPAGHQSARRAKHRSQGRQPLDGRHVINRESPVRGGTMAPLPGLTTTTRSVPGADAPGYSMAPSGLAGNVVRPVRNVVSVCLAFDHCRSIPIRRVVRERRLNHEIHLQTIAVRRTRFRA
jgi:hypothetical protein